jgi:hypothetical protein
MLTLCCCVFTRQEAEAGFRGYVWPARRREGRGWQAGRQPGQQGARGGGVRAGGGGRACASPAAHPGGAGGGGQHVGPGRQPQAVKGRRSLYAVRVSHTSLVFVGLRYYRGSATTNTCSNCKGYPQIAYPSSVTNKHEHFVLQRQYSLLTP